MNGHSTIISNGPSNGHLNGNSNGALNGHSNGLNGLSKKFSKEVEKYPILQLERDYKFERFLKFLNPTIETVDKVGVAIFGALGRAGSIHLANCLANPRVNLLYIVDKLPERRKQFRNGLGLHDVKFLGIEDQDQVFQDPEVKAIIIATFTETHKELVLKGLAHGKKVLCEKPIAQNLLEVEKCYSQADISGLTLLCAFNRRFDPSFSELKDRVKNSEVGKIHMIKTCSRDPVPPSIDYLKSSKGIIKDMAIHDLDMVCWIANEFPCKVYAAGQAHRKDIAEVPDYDTVSISLTFPSGCMAMIDLSRYAVYGYDQRLEVFGSNGMLLCNNLSTTAVESYTKNHSEKAPIFFSFPSRYEEGYKNELNHFLDVCQGKAEQLITANEIRSVYKLMQACEKSLKTGNSVEINYD